MKGTHAKLSPSGASRWMNCPGSVAAEEGYPDTSSAYAREGTAAHELAEMCLKAAHPPATGLGLTFEVEGAVIAVNDDMVHYVGLYMDQVREVNRFAAVTHVEMKAPIDHLTGEEGATGTADFVGVTFAEGKAVIRVHDLKYGQGVRVEAENNYQLLCYASGVIRELDYLIEEMEPGTVEVELHIHQPRLDHWPVWEITLEELRGYEDELRAAAAQCTPDAPRIPGEVQCRFCKARTGCPELQALILAETAEDPPTDAEAVAEVMPLLKMIRDWCATVEARAIELCEQDDPIIGKHYKLVEGRRTKVWNEDEEAIARKLKYKTGLKANDIYTKKLISPAQAEKAVPKDQLERVSKLIDKRPGKPTIAPVSDKRPAINGAEAMGFRDLSDSE